jgi:hypothetical protein
MKTNTFLKMAVLIMVLINVVLIGFMVARPKMPPRGKPVDLKNIISEKLNLDEEQQETYFELAKNHGELMAEIEQKQKPLIRDYFSFLKSEDQNFSTQDSLLTEINILESEKLIMTYNHFEQLKEICNPSQQVLFEEIIGDLIQDLLGIQKKRLPRPRD